MKQKSISILSALLVLLTLTCCSREDDVNEIFTGKTWYMNGGIINGMKLNSEVKKFYTTAEDNAYKISFSEGIFQCTLSEGVTFNGTWAADGKDQSITLKIPSKPSMDNVFDRQLFNIIQDTKYYSSGADFLYIKQDNQNQIYCGSSRSKVYN